MADCSDPSGSGRAEPPAGGRAAYRAGWFGVALLVLAAFYVCSYGDCVATFFHLDDFVILAAADRIQLHSPLDLVQFLRPLPGSVMYRPLTTLGYFYVLRHCFGHDPTGFHVAQLAFQVVNALLVYGIGDVLFCSPALGLATALVYATAPGHALAACWNAAFSITGTAIVYFLALLVWLRGNRWRGLVVLVLFAIGLLSSEHALSLPVVLMLSTVLLEPREQWRRALRALIPLAVIGAVYLGMKLYYFYDLLPVTFPSATERAFVQQAYGMSLRPDSVLRNLGRYIGFTSAVGYRVTRVETVALAAGMLLAAFALLATLCVVTQRWTSRALRVLVFGADLFIVALAPVLVLRAHPSSYYVGIAALGGGLAVIAGARALPRVSRMAPGIAVAALVLCHVFSTAALVRQGEEFRIFQGFSARAASWLYTLSVRVDAQSTSEVVVPKDAITSIVFDAGGAHRSFLCAPYEVRTSAAIDAVEPAPGRVILREPEPLPRTPGTRWDWLAQGCTPRGATSGAQLQSRSAAGKSAASSVSELARRSDPTLS
jgi:hypothetical protein